MPTDKERKPWSDKRIINFSIRKESAGSDLWDALKRQREIARAAESIHKAFEPEMDDRLAYDERKAIQRLRAAMKAERTRTKALLKQAKKGGPK